MEKDATQLPNESASQQSQLTAHAYAYSQDSSQTDPLRRNRWLLPVSFAIGCLPWIVLFAMFAAAIIGAAAGLGRGPHVALIRVSGTITTGRSSGALFGDTVAGSEDIVAQLEKARKNRYAKGILLRINSPGGSAAGSQEIYEEIVRVRRSGKPVYCSMGSVAASGGYYVASACDRIFADGGTITGSIGVIFETADLSGLFKKIGLNPQVVKSGKFKDIGSPNRPMTPEERKLLTEMLMGIYEQFVKAVAAGRRLPLQEVRKVADGRLFTGEQALKVKLVDKLGGLQEAIAELGRAVGLKEEPDVVEYGRRGLFGSLIGDDSASALRKLAPERLLYIRDLLGME
ncbi:MAG: signal peptide peptidase SppA [Armatimonadota bacterium]|nr:signal peptide peptidase SppA [Armatimonadota bacterium]